MHYKKIKTDYAFFRKQADALRKKRTAALFSKNPKKFERIYETRRLHYQKSFAEIVNALSKFGIKVSVGETEIVTKKREKTGHTHLEVKGIQAVGGALIGLPPKNI